MENNVLEIVNKIEDLNKQLKNKDITIDVRNAQIAESAATIGRLDAEIEHLKSTQPKVLKSVQIKSIDSWGEEVYKTEDLYVGLEDIKSEIEANVKKSTEKEIERLTNQVKILNKDTEGYRESINKQAKDYIKTLNKTDEEYQEKVDNLNKDKKQQYESYVEKLAKKDQEIETILVDMKKLKNKQTDEDLENKRNQEIVDLKTTIAKLTEKIARMESATFFERLFGQKKVDIIREQVEKDLVANEKLVNKIKTNSGSFTWFGKSERCPEVLIQRNGTKRNSMLNQIFNIDGFNWF